MIVTVFTSNQPRHVALIEALAEIADHVFAVFECNTVFPGLVPDFFPHSPVMRAYFEKVIAAERRVFGDPRFVPHGVDCLPIRMGDVSRLSTATLAAALDSDAVVVFGASYIRGWLCDRLIERRALNVHMGVSPYYRGSSTNFWALYDGCPELVGATVHLLTHGLDSGPVLFHALPPAVSVDPFLLGMLAVRSAHQAVVTHLAGGLGRLAPVPQDRALERRYTRNADFTDAVASEYLARLLPPSQIARRLAGREPGDYVRPFFGNAGPEVWRGDSPS